VGVLAIQGDFERHLEAVRSCGAEGREVRTPQELDRVDRLIIPGGESSTVGMLMMRFGMMEAVRARAGQGMPIWGTCMGMILLAESIEGSDQPRLGLMEITVRRNAFGAQVHSFESAVEVSILSEPLNAVFIRAPIVVQWGPSVEVICRWQDHVVGVRSGSVLGTSFHPELTDDRRMHEWFLAWDPSSSG